MLSFDSKVQRTDLAFTEIDDETVLFDPGKGKYYSLNSVGAYLWGLMGEPVEVGRLCQAVVEEFEVDLETSRVDVLEHLEHLLDRGCIRVASES